MVSLLEIVVKLQERILALEADRRAYVSSRPCRYWANGSCRFGATCRFSHGPAQPALTPRSTRQVWRPRRQEHQDQRQHETRAQLAIEIGQVASERMASPGTAPPAAPVERKDIQAQQQAQQREGELKTASPQEAKHDMAPAAASESEANVSTAAEQRGQEEELRKRTEQSRQEAARLRLQAAREAKAMEELRQDQNRRLEAKQSHRRQIAEEEKKRAEQKARAEQEQRERSARLEKAKREAELEEKKVEEERKRWANERAARNLQWMRDHWTCVMRLYNEYEETDGKLAKPCWAHGRSCNGNGCVDRDPMAWLRRLGVSQSPFLDMAEAEAIKQFKQMSEHAAAQDWWAEKGHRCR